MFPSAVGFTPLVGFGRWRGSGDDGGRGWGRAAAAAAIDAGGNGGVGGGCFGPSGVNFITFTPLTLPFAYFIRI
ncbi:hypothetical protein HanXRQr2_Chr11g0476701 [Helianthus annuus]|uniref:Uncharacterized protein n=1 Tax=Helianthus annuus TaxID=4232 RepID=A0A9K3HM64_HELAN|nr:hypothetical protein HanXRQr2_Chr11g0476701 [Helianthus annuus]